MDRLLTQCVNEIVVPLMTEFIVSRPEVVEPIHSEMNETADKVLLSANEPKGSIRNESRMYEEKRCTLH